MEKKTVIDFLKKAQSDEELATQMETVATLEDIVDLAKETGFEITLEQLDEAIKLSQLLQQVKGNREELSDKELESVSGGVTEDQATLLRLQSLSNKRGEAFEVMTNFIKKMEASRSNIIGNMR